jgi:hypothetical protein
MAARGGGSEGRWHVGCCKLEKSLDTPGGDEKATIERPRTPEHASIAVKQI